MTPAARVQAAIEVLDQVLSGTAAEKALTNWARRSRFAGSKDRAAIRDHVFQALRCRRSFAALGGGLNGRNLMLGAAWQAGIAPENIFNGERFAPEALMESEKAPGELHCQDEWDLPDWLITEFKEALGEEAQKAAFALRARAPVMVRVNLRKATAQDAIEALGQEGIEAKPSGIAPTALCLCEGARKLAHSAAYRSGIVELQDGSSQAAMALVDVPTDAKVLDYCAGGGGKTLALAARQDAHWFAHDAQFERMKDIPQRAERAEIYVNVTRSGELRSLMPFDVVLCDVPCSGSGTWRRSPEAKWRLTKSGLEQLCETQQQILHDASELVRDGGLLVYATCSVLTCENAHQIEKFQSTHPHWTCLHQQSFPISDQGDGFFVAVLRCKRGKNTQS